MKRRILASTSTELSSYTYNVRGPKVVMALGSSVFFWPRSFPSTSSKLLRGGIICMEIICPVYWYTKYSPRIIFVWAVCVEMGVSNCLQNWESVESCSKAMSPGGSVDVTGFSFFAIIASTAWSALVNFKSLYLSMPVWISIRCEPQRHGFTCSWFSTPTGLLTPELRHSIFYMYQTNTVSLVFCLSIRRPHHFDLHLTLNAPMATKVVCSLVCWNV